MYFFCNYNDHDSRHDVGHYMPWFVTWGVLCHSTVTKIMKCRGDMAHDKTGIGVVVDLHEQSICQTSYNFNVVP